MTMGNLFRHLRYLLVMLDTKEGQHARIEFLVVAATIVLFVMSTLDSQRYRSQSRAVRCTIVFVDAFADSIVSYTLGLMQLANNFHNELFQVWALLLVTLKGNTRYISAYSLQDNDNWRSKEIKNMLDSFFLANLIATKGTQFKVPLWVLWGLNQLKIVLNLWAFDRVCHSDTNTRLEDEYIKLWNTHEAKLADKMWERERRLPESANNTDSHKARHTSKRPEDIGLSHALFKILRQRFRGSGDHLDDKEREGNDKIVPMLLEEEDNSERLFRIVRTELAFLNDYLHTRFPIVFTTGLPYIYLVVYLGVSVVGGWLAAELLLDRGYTIDVIITFAVIILMKLAEWWELTTYIFSNWNKVLMLSKFGEKTSSNKAKDAKKTLSHKAKLAKKLLGFLCNNTVIIDWDNRLGQHRFLESFNYHPWIRNLLSQASFGMIPRVEEGKEKKLGRLTHEVEDAIVKSLKTSLQVNSPAAAAVGNDLTALKKKGVEDLMGSWDWERELPTLTDTLLVWHIATALCEIHLSRHHLEIVKSSRRRRSASRMSRCLGSFLSFCRPYFTRGSGKEEDLETLRSSLTVAATLSNYCAYLLVFVPDLFPDDSSTKKTRVSDAVKKATKHLSGCKGEKQVYDEMKKLSERTRSSIVHKGAKLAFALIDRLNGTVKDVEDPGEDRSGGHCNIEVEKKRWEILEEFWLAFILYLAPSNNVDAHSLSLKNGGEFMTHLWALLYHAGIRAPPCKPCAR